MLDIELLPMRNDRAVLRTMRADDAAAYAEGTDDGAVRSYAHLPEPQYTEESVASLIGGAIREGLDRGNLAVLTIAEPDSDAFAGSLVVFGVSGKTAEVGFWLHPAYRGKGLAEASLRLGMTFVRRSGITTLTARTVPENEASQRVLERAGFTQKRREWGTAPSGQETELLSYAYVIEQ